jgi:hypothetical protein
MSSRRQRMPSDEEAGRNWRFAACKYQWVRPLSRLVNAELIARRQSTFK